MWNELQDMQGLSCLYPSGEESRNQNVLLHRLQTRDKKCAFIKKGCHLLLSGQIEYCYECSDFPCEKLRKLDKKYRTRFRMSMIENLQYIKENGIKQFLIREEQKWKCPDCGETICCHNGICFNCGLDLLRNKKKLYRWEDD